MRIISGSARGRKLKGPPSHATRPMTDKIREAVFNSLASLGVWPEHVVDMYAGTGAIGIEALSRGAESVDFVEMGREQVAVIRDNLRTTGFDSKARVHQTSVESFIERAQEPVDFVVLDPPYADPKIIPTLEKLASSKLVQSGTIVVLGHSPRVEPPDTIGTLQVLRHRCHGDTCFSIYENAPDEDQA
ncbi:MAG: 16S rRNA (guanine(966)-N(2))-methyltransferase RsmD [Thermomicrobiales bacterium]|nr:16S rRNA (guanine(966)-N(2))-methyltransferase RsmD [Thermomicrobiales bacterium]MCO5217654.1 16S rRNA (guanine(966)-N(2))-methyltransferase RsmD [Thermomicrobiales bacterium]MCO5228163.1 16S rRNA (guanine(966)-N(2))-methyltransferase RsmD [Thermomicrobiales bacterium]